MSTGNFLPSSRSALISSMPDILGRPRSMMPRSNGTSRPMYRPSSPSWAASTAKPSRFRRADSVSRSGASSSTSRMRMVTPCQAGPAAVGSEGGVAVVVVVCTAALGRRVATTLLRIRRILRPGRRIIPVHPHPTLVVDDLDTIHVAPVVLHLFGAEHLAVAFGASHRVGEPLLVASGMALRIDWRMPLRRRRLRLRPRHGAGTHQGDEQRQRTKEAQQGHRVGLAGRDATPRRRRGAMPKAGVAWSGRHSLNRAVNPV